MSGQIDPRAFRQVLGQFCTGITIITTVHDEDLGPLRMQNLMFRLSGTPGAIRYPGRRLGQVDLQGHRRLHARVRRGPPASCRVCRRL